MVNVLVQKRVNVKNVLTSGTIRVRNGSFALMIILAIHHMADISKWIIICLIRTYLELWFSFNTHKSFAFY